MSNAHTLKRRKLVLPSSGAVCNEANAEKVKE